MKVLTKVARIEKEVIRLIKECESCKIAVAWATVGFKAYKCLMEHRDKIKRMVVGAHLYGTNPAFMEEFLDNEEVHFVMPPHSGGLFHPKLYLFDMGDGRWECIIGSPNFTTGGFHKNDEAAILFTSHDEGAEEAFTDINSTITEYWEKASAISAGDLEIYKESYERKRPHWNKLEDKYNFVTMTWPEFFAEVKADKFHRLEGRLKVISAVQQLFRDKSRFSEIDPNGQKQIAGTAGNQEGINFGWFGSMSPNIYFKRALKDNQSILSDALKWIPLVDDIDKEMYLNFVEKYKEAFLNETGDGIITASRLLAMKRPDLFVCVTGPNKDRLYDGYGLTIEKLPRKGYVEYWELLIEQIWKSSWWKSPRPKAVEERNVWNAKAAFLDAICYQKSG